MEKKDKHVYSNIAFCLSQYKFPMPVGECSAVKEFSSKVFTVDFRKLERVPAYSWDYKLLLIHSFKNYIPLFQLTSNGKYCNFYLQKKSY
jgi:hypothetical protein